MISWSHWGSDLRNKIVRKEVFQKLYSAFVLIVFFEIKIEISRQKSNFTLGFNFWKK